MPISLQQFPYLDFWSRLHITGGEQGKPIKLEIIQKTDKTFRLTSSEIQHGNSNSRDFIEDPKKLEATGFFQALSFLDDLKNGAPIVEELKTLDALNYIKQDDPVINDFKINGQNSNNSTKEVLLLRRSERIAKRKLAIKENSSSSIETSSPKKRYLPPMKLSVGFKENAFYNLSYGP